MSESSKSPLDTALVSRAAAALLQHVSRREASKAATPLFPKASGEGEDVSIRDAEPVILVAAQRRVPARIRVKPQRLSVPNSLWGPESEVCLIVKDPQRTYKDLLEAENERAEALRAGGQTGGRNGGSRRRQKSRNADSSSDSGGSGSDSDSDSDSSDTGEDDNRHIPVTLVLGLQKLRDNYKTFEDKRRLSAGYDLFLVDDRILPLVPKLLGKSFFYKKKQPVAVEVSRVGSWARNVRRAVYGATYFHQNAGACTAIRAGHTAMTASQLSDNIIAAANDFALHIPSRWKNIQSLHVKTTNSVALPVFHSEIGADAGAGRRKDSGEDGDKTEASSASSASPVKKRTRPDKTEKETAPAKKGKKQGTAASASSSAAKGRSRKSRKTA
jgi:ribosome biogenesis protein UTP30